MRHHRLHTVAARVVRRQAEEDLLDELVHQSLRHAACLTGPGAPAASGGGRIFFLIKHTCIKHKDTVQSRGRWVCLMTREERVTIAWMTSLPMRVC